MFPGNPTTPHSAHASRIRKPPGAFDPSTPRNGSELLLFTSTKSCQTKRAAPRYAQARMQLPAKNGRQQLKMAGNSNSKDSDEETVIAYLPRNGSGIL